jgi:hypothetical protein
MSGSASNRIPPNLVGLIFFLLLGAWLTFVYWPRRKEVLSPVAPMTVESKLEAAGLENNPDWEGLPEFFAIWADKIEWNDNKAYFAYWHPGARAYAYLFEAVRREGKYRFRTVLLQELVEGNYHAEDADVTAVVRWESEVPTHPFVFLIRLTSEIRGRPFGMELRPPEPDSRMVPVDLKPAPLVVPAPAKPTTP